jgi:hypothetical protein
LRSLVFEARPVDDILYLVCAAGLFLAFGGYAALLRRL